MQKILPQYDNPLTHDWLMTLLVDLGIAPEDGRLVFSVERGALDLLRVVARFHFTRSTRLVAHGEVFSFASGDDIQMFFSYRYKPARVAEALTHHGIMVLSQWQASSEEEGVFLCHRAQLTSP